MSVFRGRARMYLYAGMVPGILTYLLFGVVPSVATAIISLTNYTGIPGVPPQFVGLRNYVQAFTIDAPGVSASLLDTLVFCASVTVIQNALGLLVASALRKGTPVTNALRSLVFLPAVLGVTVIGLTWALIFDPSEGPAAAVAKLLGTTSSFFGSQSLALPLVIFVQIWANLGFTTLVYLAGMNAIPAEFYEAAALDGVRGWTVFRYVTFPLLAPSVTVNVFLAVVGSLNTYDLIYVLTDGLYHTNTLAMFMFNTAFQGSGDLGFGATLSMILFGVTLVIALPLQRYLRAREVAL